MKHLVCIYILLFALAMPHLNSCQRANTRQELERADSLLECVPMDTNTITELQQSRLCFIEEGEFEQIVGH